MKEKPFRTEADLCAAFIAAVPNPWKCYPETEGWDILLIHSGDGSQVGVQAKLKLNAKVMLQAAEDSTSIYSESGPDYRAVLVPGGESNELQGLAPYCGLTVIRMYASMYGRRSPFAPALPLIADRYSGLGEWHEMLPTRRYRVPEYQSDAACGTPSPIQLTRWKIEAIKLCVLLEQTGYLTRDDFKRHQIDVRRWIGRWLMPTPLGFVAGPAFPDFKTPHPRVWAEIEAEPKKWQRPVPLMMVRHVEVRVLGGAP